MSHQNFEDTVTRRIANPEAEITQADYQASYDEALRQLTVGLAKAHLHQDEVSRALINRVLRHMVNDEEATVEDLVFQVGIAVITSFDLSAAAGEAGFELAHPTSLEALLG